MHGEPAAKLMERGRMLVREAETKDERDEMIAYLMGVACHFCLDNRVHAYVNAEEKRTGSPTRRSRRNWNEDFWSGNICARCTRTSPVI